MIKIACPLCRGKNHQKLYQKDGFWLVECQDCGLVFVNPRLTVSKLRKHYDKQYYKSDNPSDKTRYTDYNYRYLKSHEKKRFQDVFKNLAKFLPKKGSLLDVGAATGFLVQEANKRGWQGEGVEISQWAALWARKNLKVKIFSGDLFEGGFDNQSFDAITLLDVLEHLENPIKELKEAYRILKKGGVIYIETINFDNFITRHVIGKNYKHMVPAYHLIYFGRRQIREFLRKANFKILKENLTSSSVGDYEYEGMRMYWQYCKLLLHPQEKTNFALNDVIKIYAKKI